MPKIINKIVEPTIIYTEEQFIIKVKVKRAITYLELKQLTYDDTKDYSYGELKGD